MTTTRSRRGFTLVEVLAATALFAVLGTMLFQLIQGAMDVSGRGERLGELEERANAVLDLLAEDLRHTWPGIAGPGEQEARFLCTYRLDTVSGEGEETAQVTPVLRFTRVLHEARSLAWLRRAGSVAGAEGVATLTGVEDPRELQPTGGLAESLYAAVRLPGEHLPSLLRRVRTPIGGPGSLLDPDLPDQPDRLVQDAVRLADGVLHFQVDCWSPDTTAWDVAEGEPGRAALPMWDSTRGLLPPGDAVFPYGRGPESLFDARDDLFPPLVRITLVLDPFLGRADGARNAPGQLAADVGSESDTIRLRSSRLGGDDRRPDWIWVEGEWMELLDMNGTLAKVRRGALHSLSQPHKTGALVRVGHRYQRIVRIPAARENFNR